MASDNHWDHSCIRQGGHDYELFLAQEHTLVDFRCIICQNVARNAHQVTCCGKIVCKDCLEMLYEHSQHHRNEVPCPHCRQRVMGNCFQDKRSHQTIISLAVRCTYHKYGCMWQGELKVYEETHLSHCTFQLATCRACNKDVPKELFKKHNLEECEKRFYNCPHCGIHAQYDEIMKSHSKMCTLWPIECPSGCGVEIRRVEIEQHRKSCCLQMVNCRYHANGCQVIVIRADLQVHENECAKQHLEITNTELTHLRREHNDLRVEYIREMELKRIAPIKFGLKGYQKHLEDKAVWESQSFYTHPRGYLLCLRVYLHGCNSGRDDYISCYCHIMSGPFDNNLSWPFKGILKVSLKNQVEDTNHWEKEIKFITSMCKQYNMPATNGSCCNCIGLGEPQFIKHKQLELDADKNCQFLLEDQLIFQVDYYIYEHRTCDQRPWLSNLHY